MPISVDCPQCGKPHHLANELGGKRIRCVACREILTVPPADYEPRAVTVVQKETRLSAECSACSCTMLVANAHAGKTIRCVRCQTPVQVPADIAQQQPTQNTERSIRSIPQASRVSRPKANLNPNVKSIPSRPRRNRDNDNPGRRRRQSSIEEQQHTTDELEDRFREEIERDECLATLSEKERIAYGLASTEQEVQPTTIDRRGSVMAFGYRDDMGMHQSSSGNWNIMLFSILAGILCLGTFIVVQKHINEPQSGQSSLMLDLAIVVGLSPLVAASLTFQLIAYSEDLVTGFLMRRIPFMALICLFDNRYNHPMVWKMFLVGLAMFALTLPVMLISN